MKVRPRVNVGPVGMTVPQFLHHECTIGGVVTHLTPLETELLSALLVRHPARLIEYADLIDAVWPDPDASPLSVRNEIQVLIARLRDKGVFIEVEFGRGVRVPEAARTARTIPEARRCPTCRQRLAA